MTVAGAYGALGILAFIILAIWHAAGEPGSGQLNRVFNASLMIMLVLGMVVASWASIWLLVIAFRDKLEQGLLVLLVPFYFIYYMFSRWRETRGIFAMCIAPICTWILFAFFGGLVLGLAGPRAVVDAVWNRLQGLAPDFTSGVDPVRLAEADLLCRDYIQAMNRWTDELSRVQLIGPGAIEPLRAWTKPGDRWMPLKSG